MLDTETRLEGILYGEFCMWNIWRTREVVDVEEVVKEVRKKN